MHTQLHHTELVKAAGHYFCFCFCNGTQDGQVSPHERAVVGGTCGSCVVAGGELHKVVLEVEIDGWLVHHKWVACVSWECA